MRALLTATFALAALVLSAPLASAAPPAADPPDILTPASPPDPEPCTAHPVPCDITLPTFTVATPTPVEPPTTTTTTPPPSSTTNAESGTGSDTDAGTASGPVKSTPARQTEPTSTEWWLIAVPALALLTLAAAGAFLLIQRSERRS
jgi:uncharacterized membrane protein